MQFFALCLIFCAFLVQFSHSKIEQIATPAPKPTPMSALVRKGLVKMKGLKPTPEDNIRRMNPDAFDNDSDEDVSDPLSYVPFDFEYVKYLMKNPDVNFNRETIKYWQDDAKNNKFCHFDETW